MNRMHKPNPKLGTPKQNKRSVISIEAGDVDAWLAGTMEQAQALLRLTPVEVFAAGPAELLPDDLRQRAIAAEEAMLAHKGVTVEQCATIGTRPTKPVRPGTIPSFFGGMGGAALRGWRHAPSCRTCTART
ncbi:hypothetical protein PMI14_05276 [Acidovorax sp. CF316]|uniref:hypothetical protein n=1 Tax=Acidovorax sp. CF316 TaxID=1144317 RepID=UPI00026BCBE1|nr:hypothetical protein PMI14_05276 [Acidovorax sp. CF316]